MSCLFYVTVTVTESYYVCLEPLHIRSTWSFHYACLFQTAHLYSESDTLNLHPNGELNIYAAKKKKKDDGTSYCQFA